MPRANAVVPLLAVLLSACPIAPDQAPDAGPVDAGTDAGVDGGTTDAGTASGAISATLTVSNSTVQPALSWNNFDLGQTSVDTQGAAGPSQVTLRGTNVVAGSFQLTLTNLIPGSSAVTFSAVRYIPATGPDVWSCDTQSVACPLPLISLSDYDGGFIAGTFDVSFYMDSDGNTAQLNPGSFAVQLP